LDPTRRRRDLHYSAYVVHQDHLGDLLTVCYLQTNLSSLVSPHLLDRSTLSPPLSCSDYQPLNWVGVVSLVVVPGRHGHRKVLRRERRVKYRLALLIVFVMAVAMCMKVAKALPSAMGCNSNNMVVEYVSFRDDSLVD
jgi:hypothetical protein